MATLNEKIKLLQGLITAETAKIGPFYVSIDLTRRCNLRCIGCPYRSGDRAERLRENLSAEETALPQEDDLPVPVFKKLCSDLRDMNTKELILQGQGEPLLHPRIFDIIAIAKDKGFKLLLLTNGTLLDKKRCRSLIDLGLDKLRVSLWSSTREDYVQTNPGTNPKNFDKVLNGMKLLTDLKTELGSELPELCLNQPISRHNHKSIDALVDITLATGCNSLKVTPLSVTTEELVSSALSPDEISELRVKFSETKARLASLKIKHNIDRLLLDYDIGEDVWNKVLCYIGWVHARIGVNGGVRPCAPYVKTLGNINKQSFREIWDGSGFRSFRRQTMTRKGLLAISTKDSNCGYCCYVGDNQRIHSFFKWLSAFISKRGEKTNQTQKKPFGSSDHITEG
jgi:MoaA/NifB/PqqE/SkfB family radical SAM enzyme